MNRLNLILLFALFSFTTFATEAAYPFKTGDWFECEMEFDDELPVFRNHWMPDVDSIPENCAYVSVRFTFEKFDSANNPVWKYEVLRLKTVTST